MAQGMFSRGTSILIIDKSIMFSRGTSILMIGKSMVIGRYVVLPNINSSLPFSQERSGPYLYPEFSM